MSAKIAFGPKSFEQSRIDGGWKHTLLPILVFYAPMKVNGNPVGLKV